MANATPRADASPGRGGPAPGRLTRIALGLVPALMGLLTLRRVASPDVGFHLRAGKHILSGNGWPRTDPFTFTVGDHAYIDTSWGFQVVLALCERLGGTTGMVLLHVALVVALFTLLILTARIVGGDRHLLVLLLLLGGLAAEPRFEVRPEIWSYVLLALLLYLLHRHAEGRTSPLWLLPVIFLVWVNSHSLFILGWAVLGAFVLGLWLRRREPDRRLLGWAAAGLAVGLVNPYGYKALLFPFTLSTRMSGENLFGRQIGEFGSTLAYAFSDQLTYYLVPTLCFFLFAFLVLLSTRRLWRQRRFWCLLLVVAFLPLSLVMVRNVPLLTIVCLPGAAWGFSVERLIGRLRIQGYARRRLDRSIAGLLIAVIAVFGMRVATDAYYVSSRRLERTGLGWNRLALPVGAVAHVNAVGLSGRVLNHLNFGGYLMWARDAPVFIDGRLEVMGERFFAEYREALASREGLEAEVERRGIVWNVFPYRLRPDLLAGLSRDWSWRLIYVDHLAVVFVREAAGSDELVHRDVLALDDDARRSIDIRALPGLGGDPIPGRVSRWLSGLIRRQDYPDAAFNRGVFHYHRAEGLAAVRSFAEAVEESRGIYYEIYNNLGAALFAVGRIEDARACYRIYERELPFFRKERRRRVRERLKEIENRTLAQ